MHARLSESWAVATLTCIIINSSGLVWLTRVPSVANPPLFKILGPSYLSTFFIMSDVAAINAIDHPITVGAFPSLTSFIPHIITLFSPH